MGFSRFGRSGKSGLTQGWTSNRSRGLTPLDFSKPIGQAQLDQTQADLQRQAQQLLPYTQEGSAEYKRLEQIAQGGVPSLGAVDKILQPLDALGTAVRLGIRELTQGSENFNFTAEDFADLMTLNAEDVAARHPEAFRGDNRYSGSDLLTDLTGWEPYGDAPGPVDEIKKFLRWIPASGLEIFTDPINLFTGGLAGLSRHAAVEVSEFVVKNAAREAADTLKSRGLGLLDTQLDELTELTPLAREVAGRAQEKTSRAWAALATDHMDDVRKTELIQSLVDDAVGFKHADDLSDLGTAKLAGMTGEQVDDIAVGQFKDMKDAGLWKRKLEVGGVLEDTAYTEVVGDVVTHVANKQFHRQTPIWKAYTDTVLQGTSGAANKQAWQAYSTIGGLKFQVPFVPSSTRTFGALTKATQGKVSRLTRGQSALSFNQLRDKSVIATARRKWRNLRKNADTRQMAVLYLTDPGVSQADRVAKYISLRETQTARSLAEAGTVDLAVITRIDQLYRSYDNIATELNLDDVNELNRVVYSAFLRKQTPPMQTFIDAGVDMTEGQYGRIKDFVEEAVQQQDAATKRYASFDRDFAALLEASDRLYTPIKNTPELIDSGRYLAEDYNKVAGRFTEYVKSRRAEGITDKNQLIDDYATAIGELAGVDLNADEMSMFLTMIDSFRIGGGDGLAEAVGDATVLKARRIGTGAIITEKDGRLGFDPEFTDLANLNDKFTKLVNFLMKDVPGYKPLDNVFDINPASLLRHWVGSVSEAAVERAQFSLLHAAGYISDRAEKMVAVSAYLNRVARNGALEEVANFGLKLNNIINEDGIIDEVSLKRILDDGVYRTVKQEIGGVSFDIPAAAMADPKFRQEISRLGGYVEHLRSPRSSRAVVADILEDIDFSNVSARQFRAKLNQALKGQMDRRANDARRALRDFHDDNLEHVEQVITRAGGTTDDVAEVLDQLKKEAERHYAALDDMVSAQTGARDELVDTVMAQSRRANVQGEEAQRIARDTPIGQSKESVLLDSPEAIQELVDKAIEVLDDPIQHLSRKLDEVTDADDARLIQIELLERRRLAENMDEIQPEFVASLGDQLDVGWVKPTPGDADLWVEYWPGFGGLSFAKGGGRHWPTVNGRVSEQLAETLGWSKASGKTATRFFEESFDEIAPGLFKFNKPIETPLLVFGHYGLADQHQTVQRQLSRVWRTRNAFTAPDADFLPVRIHGLSSTGIEPIDQASPNAVIRTVERMKRGRGPLRQRNIFSQRIGKYYYDRQLAPADEVYDEWLNQLTNDTLAAKALPRSEFTRVKRQVKNSYPLAGFLTGFDSAINYKSGYVGTVEYMNRGAADAADVWELHAQSMVPLRSSIINEAAVDYNQRLVEDALMALGEETNRLTALLADRPRGTSAREVRRQLKQVQRNVEALSGTDLSNVDEVVSRLSNVGIEAATPWQDVTQMALPIRRTAHVLGEYEIPLDRWTWNPNFEEWLTARTETGTVIERINQLELSEGRLIEDLYDEVIGYEHAPELPDSVRTIVEGAFADTFPGERDVPLFEKYIRLRQEGWWGTGQDMRRWADAEPEAALGSLTDFDSLGISTEQAKRTAQAARLQAESPQLEAEFRDVLGAFDSSPRLPTWGDNSEFWTWLETNYPGTSRILETKMERRPEVDFIDFGADIKAKEYEIRHGRRGTDEDVETFDSIFGDSYEDIANRFIQAVEESDGMVHDEFAPIWTRFRESQLQPDVSNVRDELLPAVWLRTGGRLDKWPEEDVYALFDGMIGASGEIRAQRGIGTRFLGTADIAPDELLDVEDYAELGRRLTDGMPDDVGEDWAIAEAEGLASELGGPKWDPMKEQLYGSDLPPLERALQAYAQGQAYVDLDEMFLLAHRRMYPSSFVTEVVDRDIEKALKVAGRELNLEADLADERDLQELPDLVARAAGYKDPLGAPGIDPQVVDEFGRPQKTRLDPRPLYPERPRTPAQVRDEFQTTFKGDLEFFVPRQRQIIERLTSVTFDRAAYSDARRLQEAPEFIEQANALLGRVFTQQGERLALLTEINLTQAQRAWSAFQTSLEPKYLQDAHLMQAIGLGSFLAAEGMPDPKTFAARIRAEKLADAGVPESIAARRAMNLSKRSELLFKDMERADAHTGFFLMGHHLPQLNKPASFEVKRSQLNTLLSADTPPPHSNFQTVLGGSAADAYKTSAHAVYVGRDLNPQRGKWGNPFITKGKDSRYVGKDHPWLKVWQPVTGSTEGRWVPVKYQGGVLSEAHANYEYHQLLWRMLDDPEMGPVWRAELVEELGQKVLWNYGKQDAAGHNKVLSEAVEWINDGMFDLHGPPMGDLATPLPKHAKLKNKLDALAVIDWEGADRLLNTYMAGSDAAAQVNREIVADEILRKKLRDPDWLDNINVEVPDDPRSADFIGLTERALIPHQIDTSPESWWFIDQMFKNDPDPDLEVFNRMAQLVYGKDTHVAVHVTEDGTTILRVDPTGSEFANWRSQMDRVEFNAERGIKGTRQPELTETTDELIEMGEDEAARRGMTASYDVARARQELKDKIDDYQRQLDELATRQELTSEQTKRGVEAEIGIKDWSRDLKEFDEIVNLSWRVLQHPRGENRFLRRVLGVTDKAPFGSGERLDRWEDLLGRLAPREANDMRFLVDSALIADNLIRTQGFDEWLSYFQRNLASNQRVSRTIERVARFQIEQAQLDPVRWTQLLEFGSPLQHHVRSFVNDLFQLARVFPDGDDVFVEAATKIGKSTDSNLDVLFGADVAAIERGNMVDLIGALRNHAEFSLQQPEVARLINQGIGFDKVTEMTKLKNAIDQLGIRPEEYNVLSDLLPAEHFNMAGIYSGMFMDAAVGHELRRATARMAAAADVRNSMEIMGAAHSLKSLWQKAATVARPTFHMRNLIGGMWNNLLIGVNPWRTVRMMPDVMQYVRNRRRMAHLVEFNAATDDVLIDLVLDGVKQKDMFRHAIRSGILDTAFSSTLSYSPTKVRGWRKVNPFSADGFVGYQWGGNTMEFVEGVLRMAAFERYFDEANPFTSSMFGKTMVNMVHFDYTNLSAVDEKIKTFVPFWVWTSRNLPLQMRYLLESPRYLNMFLTARENWNDQFQWTTDEDGRLVPIEEAEWSRGGARWILPFRREDASGNWVQMSWEPALPFMDLLETPLFEGPFQASVGDIELPVSAQVGDLGQWVAWASGSLAPQLSIFTDLATTPSQEFQTKNAPAGLNGLLRLMPFSDVTPQGDAQVPRWVGKTISTGLPFYSEYTELMGVRSTSPYSAGNQGLLPDEFQGDPGVGTAMQVMSQRLGRGFGFYWQSPEDAFWTYKELQRWLDAERIRARGQQSEPFVGETG